MEELKSSDFISCYGDEGLLKVSKYHKYDNELLVNALVGSAGLKPTVEAINAGKNIALANKETLVMAGDQVKALLREKSLNYIRLIQSIVQFGNVFKERIKEKLSH